MSNLSYFLAAFLIALGAVMEHVGHVSSAHFDYCAGLIVAIEGATRAIQEGL